MKIKLSPARMDENLIASVNGDSITVNGIAFDFSPLPDGGVLPAEAINSFWIVGEVMRSNGEICLTLRLPHGHNAPVETRFPAAFDNPMTIVGGPVSLPPYDASADEVGVDA